MENTRVESEHERLQRLYSIPAKKVRKKSTWMTGFVFTPPVDEDDKVTIDRCLRIQDKTHKRIKRRGY